VKESVNVIEKNGIEMDKERCAYHGDKWNGARRWFIVCKHESIFTIARGKKSSTRRETGKKEPSDRLLLIDELIYRRTHLLMMNIGRKYVAPVTFTLFARVLSASLKRFQLDDRLYELRTSVTINQFIVPIQIIP